MTVTLYVDGWYEQPSSVEVVDAREQFPEFDERDFINFEFPKNSEGIPVSVETVFANPFPEITLSGSSWSSLVRLLCLDKDTGGDVLSLKEVAYLSGKIKSILSKKRVLKRSLETDRLSFQAFIAQVVTPKDPHPDEAYIRAKLKELYLLLQFAQKQKRSVYWG